MYQNLQIRSCNQTNLYIKQNGQIYLLWISLFILYSFFLTSSLSAQNSPWSKKADMPTGRAALSSVVVNDKNYLIGNSSTSWSFTPTSSVFEFMPRITRNVPAGYQTIQAAIDSSIDGDLVLVEDGTYYENINFKGKTITVASHFYMNGDTNHINNTIIDGSQPTNPDSGSVVFFVSGEDTNSVLTGFTVTGGTGSYVRILPHWSHGIFGGCILILGSGAKIEKNKIINNNINRAAPYDTAANGIAIGAYDGDVGDYLVIRDNLISENTATADFAIWGSVTIGMKETSVFERNVVSNNVVNARYAFGGGLVLFGYEGWQGAYIVRNNLIKNNTVTATSQSWAGGVYIANCSPAVTNNIISANSAWYGGGVVVRLVTQYSGIPNPVLINNTIVNNSARDYGGGLEVGGTSQTTATVMNNILWGNSANIAGPQIDVYGDASITVRYSDVQGSWPGEGNIDADPFFSDSFFNLANSSQCIGAGTDSAYGYAAPLFDFDGDPRPNPVDMLIDIGAQESTFGKPTGIVDDKLNLLLKFTLQQNYPNPFNPTTTFKYQLPKSSQVELTVYSLLGQRVATLVNKKQSAGTYNVDWNASDFASGVYYYKIQAGTFVQSKKLLFIK